MDCHSWILKVKTCWFIFSPPFLDHCWMDYCEVLKAFMFPTGWGVDNSGDPDFSSCSIINLLFSPIVWLTSKLTLFPSASAVHLVVYALINIIMSILRRKNLRNSKTRGLRNIRQLQHLPLGDKKLYTIHVKVDFTLKQSGNQLPQNCQFYFWIIHYSCPESVIIGVHVMLGLMCQQYLLIAGVKIFVN